jgi:hypothetical protein
MTNLIVNEISFSNFTKNIYDKLVLKLIKKGTIFDAYIWRNIGWCLL